MISLDFDEFEADAEEFTQKMKDDYNRWIKKHAIDLLKRTIHKTPVDTGTLIDGWDLDFDFIDGWLTVYIENFVSYAEYVEYGTDRMDARLMLTLSLDEVAARMEQEADKS